MRGIVKVFVVWTLGFVMLFGSTGVSLALPKIQGGHSYCQCSCRNATGLLLLIPSEDNLGSEYNHLLPVSRLQVCSGAS